MKIILVLQSKDSVDETVSLKYQCEIAAQTATESGTKFVARFQDYASGLRTRTGLKTSLPREWSDRCKKYRAVISLVK